MLASSPTRSIQSGSRLIEIDKSLAQLDSIKSERVGNMFSSIEPHCHENHSSTKCLVQLFGSRDNRDGGAARHTAIRRIDDLVFIEAGVSYQTTWV